METEKIRRCPWCGSTEMIMTKLPAHVIYTDYVKTENDHVYSALCKDGCYGGIYLTFDVPTEDEAWELLDQIALEE